MRIIKSGFQIPKLFKQSRHLRNTMFKKKKCGKCGKKIGEKYSFCPYCGSQISSENDEDFGMLGKNDFMPLANDLKLPFGLNAIFNSLMKNLSKEMEEQMKSNFAQEQPKKVKKDGISISISTFGNGAPRVNVTPMGNQKIEQEKPNEKIKQNNFTKEKIKKFNALKREEPKTNIRRLSNKLVYEIEMPGVKTIEDISISQLENSIEIKAIGEKKAYGKIIPISLPIKNYDLSEGKLILELGIKN
jgi:HSP20 family molecular chaperone IbpA